MLESENNIDRLREFNKLAQEGIRQASENFKKSEKTESNEVRYSISTDIDGNKYVQVDEDAIDTTDGKSIASNIAAIIKERFNNIVLANGQYIRVNSKTNSEFRSSEWARTLKAINEDWYKDKIKSLANANEILKSASDWVNEDIKHKRNDNITSFARGNILYKVGESGYSADILVGLKNDGSAVLYDIIGVDNKKITDNSYGGGANNNPSRARVPVVDIKPQSENDVNKYSIISDNFNELYETLDDGRLKVKSARDLSTQDWEIIYKTMKKLGYEIKSAKDAKEVYSKYSDSPVFNPEQSKALMQAFGIGEESGPKENPKRMLTAEKEFGITTDFAEAGYLLRDGKMLDFSGKKEGGPRHQRAMDHREIAKVFDTSNSEIYDSNTQYMNAFIAEGNIRLMDGNGVTIGEIEPNAKQYALLKQFINRVLKSDDYFWLDLCNSDGRNIENREYEESDGADKIISDIKAYFKNGELPYRSELQSFYTKYSIVSDSDYMKAVESGNTEQAQSMVEEAAKKAGYNEISYSLADDTYNRSVADYIRDRIRDENFGSFPKFQQNFCHDFFVKNNIFLFS